MTSKIDLAIEYFTIFSDKDLQKLSLMFDKNVILKDWDISAYGYKEVLEANDKIFKTVKTIKVTPLHIAENKNRVFAELEICINDELLLNVVDIITFTDNCKIIQIFAFKR